jgi:hypothetical protein
VCDEGGVYGPNPLERVQQRVVVLVVLVVIVVQKRTVRVQKGEWVDLDVGEWQFRDSTQESTK